MEKKQEIKQFIEKRMIKQIGHIDPISDFWIETILAYNLDRESPPVTGTAEEMEKGQLRLSKGGQLLPENIIAEQELDALACEYANSKYAGTKDVYPAYFGFIAGYKAHSITIERLTKALRLILRTPSKSECDIIAHEALDSIKK